MLADDQAPGVGRAAAPEVRACLAQPLMERLEARAGGAPRAVVTPPGSRAEGLVDVCLEGAPSEEEGAAGAELAALGATGRLLGLGEGCHGGQPRGLELLRHSRANGSK